MSDSANAARLREAGLAAERNGKVDDAKAAFLAAVAAAPGNAALLNSAGGFWSRQGNPRRAHDLFAAALMAQSDLIEARINQAIALMALGRPETALALLDKAATPQRTGARFWSVHGNAAREAGQLRTAAISYERCLSAQPDHGRGLHGRARVALERADPSAPRFFEAALAVSPRDADLWLGRGQALLAAGDATAARDIAKALTEQAPGWPAALEFLAQLRWEAGETDFCGHYAHATKRSGGAVAVIQSWCNMLAGADRPAEAARIALAHGALRDEPGLKLMAAGYASQAGDLEAAQTLFEQLPSGTPGLATTKARHALRRDDPVAAGRVLDGALAAMPWDVAAWALRGLVWRLTDDPRSHWLHGAEGMIRELDLGLDERAMTEVTAALEAAHARSARPLGQSVKRGTQTRGALLEADEPAILALGTALNAALQQYRAGLPAADPAHPLLRHRNSAWSIIGSWSVLLDRAGWHAPHTHSQGMVSSACYFVVPSADPQDPLAGALEFGRAPPDLNVDLPPLAMVEPRPGKLVLFPSTLFHGTRRFDRGRRMTVAFDVKPVASSI